MTQPPQASKYTFQLSKEEANGIGAVPLQDSPQRPQIAEALNVLFASMEILCIKSRGFTFNIMSKDFYEFHSFFNLTIKFLQDNSYEIAERVRSLGELALVSADEIIHRSLVKNEQRTITDPSMMTQELLHDYSMLASWCRQIFKVAGSAGDAGTVGLMTKTTGQLEHFQWELRSMTEKYFK